MSPATIRISARSARVILEAICTDDMLGPREHRAINEMRSALAPSPKRVTAKRAAKQRRESKRATKREQTAAIRATVFERADGLCEFACGREATDLHHSFGRVRVPQSTENCLALCRSCHRALTANRPSARYWFECQAEVFRRLGHKATSETLLGLAAKAEAKASLGGVSR
jgi:hypothetical protein